MEEIQVKDIINKLYKTLAQKEIWFTTKNDATYYDAKSYYKLDEYGDLEEKEEEKIAKEIDNFIGDGAIEIDDAITLWIDTSLNEYKLAFKDQLLTKFKNKQVIPNIEAYEVKLEEKQQVKKNKVLVNENKKRLQEVNLLSIEEFDKIINDEKFDADSAYGNIIVRAKELFDILQNNGFVVEASADNGQVDLSIIMGTEGGLINITILDRSGVKAFASGNFEISEETIRLQEKFLNILVDFNSGKKLNESLDLLLDDDKKIDLEDLDTEDKIRDVLNSELDYTLLGMEVCHDCNNIFYEGDGVYEQHIKDSIDVWDSYNQNHGEEESNYTVMSWECPYCNNEIYDIEEDSVPEATIESLWEAPNAEKYVKGINKIKKEIQESEEK